MIYQDVDVPYEESVDYTSPIVTPNKYYFAEHFDDVDKFKQRWTLSQAKKDGADAEIAKYDGEWQVNRGVDPVINEILFDSDVIVIAGRASTKSHFER